MVVVLKVLRQAGRAKEGQTEIQVAAASEARQQRGLHSTAPPDPGRDTQCSNIYR